MLQGRFRRVGRLTDDEAGNRAVAQAVARAKQGDREALRYLYVHYADHVYGYVASIVRDDYEAEDVTQHVFAKLMTVAPEVRAARGAVLGLDHPRGAQRRRRPHAPAPRDPLRGGPRARDVASTTTSTSRHRSLGLRDALATLPEDQRQVVVMRHLIGLTPGEIADQLGRTEPSIHGLHHRGRGALRTALADMECGPTIAGRVAA